MAWQTTVNYRSNYMWLQPGNIGMLLWDPSFSWEMGFAVVHAIQNDGHVLFWMSLCLVTVMVVVFSFFPKFVKIEIGRLFDIKTRSKDRNCFWHFHSDCIKLQFKKKKKKPYVFNIFRLIKHFRKNNLRIRQKSWNWKELCRFLHRNSWTDRYLKFAH